MNDGVFTIAISEIDKKRIMSEYDASHFYPS